MKKVAIDARMLSSTSGIGRYIQQLTQHLQKIAPDSMEFILFLREENWSEFEVDRENFRKVKADIDWYSLSEQTKFLKILNQYDLDLIHFPHWNIPVFYQGDFVVTMHDLIMFHFPRPEATTHGKIKYWFKDKIHRFVVKQAVANSQYVITPSKFTKKDVVDTFSVEQNKIKAIYEAPFTKKNQLEEPQYKLSVSNPFVFYVGSAYPHKNLKNLIKAWNKFKAKYKTDHQLILAGEETYFYNQLKQTKAFQQESIDHIGSISDQKLNQFYSQAELFVYPSEYEGFGLPPLEALQNNTPVLTSRKASLPEVLQEASFYSDVQDTDKLAENIYQALMKNKKRNKKITKGNLLLDNYSWVKTAKQTLKVYQKQLS